MTMRRMIQAGAALAGLSLAGGALADPAPAVPEMETALSGVLGCGARTEMIADLEARFGEIFTGAAKNAPLGLVELYVSQEGSWTLLLTRPDGQSCPLAVGSDAEQVFGGGVTQGERA